MKTRIFASSSIATALTSIAVVALTVCVCGVGCAGYRAAPDASGDAESGTVAQRLDELGRKVDTQNSRLNHVIAGLQDSINVWSRSGAPLAITEGRELSGKYRIVDENEAFFDLNEYSLDSDGRSILDKVAMRLAEYPGSIVQIRGHTDKIGDPLYNEVLSHRRAATARRYLLKNWDVPLNRVFLVGFGAEDIRYPSDVSIQSNKNRRIEIQFLLPEGDTQSDGSSLP